ncbi:MAG TPA: VWA domain-containing protein [Solirubrobacteraceae bacterium]|jgi:Ca-activated chloride channel family protein|nr:VWA domain-containing protein [Solirubrobacteraceae bacterium]
MSFAVPVVLIALVAIPLLAWWYVRHQQTRERAAQAFASPALRPSVAPERPGWRRHAPYAAFALALAVLIVAAARPQTSVAVPVDDAAVFLLTDTSSSMGATDLKPSRLGAAANADRTFLANSPSSLRVGLIEFTVTASVLQSPTTNHALVARGLSALHAYGHTAIGTAIVTATQILEGLRGAGGKRLPSAMILLSDGGSFLGLDPIAAARAAAAKHIPVYTVAVGTSHGTIQGRHRPVPVPLDPTELRQIAKASGARSFTAGDSASLSAVYAHLAKQLGHKHVNHEITASFAGAGLALLLIGGALSLLWFRRLI